MLSGDLVSAATLEMAIYRTIVSGTRRLKEFCFQRSLFRGFVEFDHVCVLFSSWPCLPKAATRMQHGDHEGQCTRDNGLAYARHLRLGRVDDLIPKLSISYCRNDFSRDGR